MLNKKPLIGIIGGKGKMGNWFRIFFEKQGLPVIVSDDYNSNKKLAEKADIVIISVPIDVTEKVIKQIRRFIKKDALLSDITSLKVGPIKEMKKSNSGVLGMHPLFGPLASDLNEQTIVFCSIRKNKWTDYLKKIFSDNKAKIIELSPKKHDQQMAFLQALLHFSNISFSYFLYRKNFQPNPCFLTPPFKLQSLVLARILGQNSKLYADLEMRNPYFKKILTQYIEEISLLQKNVVNHDYKEFQKKFQQASSHFSDLTEIAKLKTSEILKMMEKQPIKIGKNKKINLQKAQIGFLGPEGTFSWQAAKMIAGNDNKIIAFSNIRDIFQAVLNQEIDFGIIPFQNSTTGLVAETIHSFVDFPVNSSGSFFLRIHHCLLSRAKKIQEIKIIKSHTQALQQCHNWLKENLPHTIKEPTASTISAILEDDKQAVGFIAPFEAKKLFKLNLLAKNIEDKKENFTRFFLISSFAVKKESLKTVQTKNTLILLSIYDRPGILRDILSIFANRGINLTALHSIPGYSQVWDYLFFLEVEKSPLSKEIIKELEKFCYSIRIIGSA